MSTRNRNVIVLVFLALLASCATSKRAAIDTGFTALNSLRDGFVAWDKEHQAQIVDKATSLEDGKAKLAAYREARVKVSNAFIAAYNSFSLAAIDVDNDETYNEAKKAVRALVDAYNALLRGDK